MRTTKSISNIAYQSPAFFSQVINDLHSSAFIGTCYWVAHQAEEDGEKDHIHFVLLGGQKTYNTEGLSAAFLPECVADERRSVTSRWNVVKDIRDWLCYGVHDPVYLLRKGTVRLYSYDWSDVHCTVGDEDTLRRDVLDARRFIDDGGDKVYRAIRIMVRQRKSWHDVICSGLIPVNCLGAAYGVYCTMWKSEYGVLLTTSANSQESLP